MVMRQRGRNGSQFLIHEKNVSGLDVERPVRTVEPKNRTEYTENEVLPPVTATLSHNKQVI
jgi:hypothetical protein